MKKIMLCAFTAVALMFGLGFEAEGMDELPAELVAKRTIAHIVWKTEWDALDNNMIIQKIDEGGYIPTNKFPGVNLDFFSCYEEHEPYKLRLILALYNSRVSIDKPYAPIAQTWSFRINGTKNTFKISEIPGKGFVFDKDETFLNFLNPLLFSVIRLEEEIVPALNQDAMTSIAYDMSSQEKENLLLQYFRGTVTLI